MKINNSVTQSLWEALRGIPATKFKNGKTAAFWHMISIIESHLNDFEYTYIKLNVDDWELANKKFELISYAIDESSPESTAARITIKDVTGEIKYLYVPSHSIEWIE